MCHQPTLYLLGFLYLVLRFEYFIKIWKHWLVLLMICQLLPVLFDPMLPSLLSLLLFIFSYSLFNNLFQGKSFNHGCSLTSSGPLTPNLLFGFLWINLLIKSAASKDHPAGISCFLIWTCLARIWSLISFLEFPL